MKFFITVQPLNAYYWTNHPTYMKAKKNEDSGLDVPMQSSIIIPANVRSFKVNLDYKGNQTRPKFVLPLGPLYLPPAFLYILTSRPESYAPQRLPLILFLILFLIDK